MAMNPQFHGTIVIGKDDLNRVEIDFGAYKATEDPNDDVGFSRMCPHCKTKTRQKIWCEPCAKEIKQNEALKGYEHKKGQFVVFTPDEVKQVDVPKDMTCDIQTAIPVDDIDPARVSDTYFLDVEDAKRHGQKYAILREAMKGQTDNDQDMALLSKMAIKGRERIVAFVPSGRGILMHILRMDEHMRKMDAIPTIAEIPEEVNQKALKSARGIIKKLAKQDWDIDELVDLKTQRLLEKVQRRLDGLDLPIEVKMVNAPRKPAIDNVEDAWAAALNGLEEPKKAKKKVLSITSLKKQKAERKAA